ncbi:23S rRNA (uracil(1939)-C(5))-methyltransferase RlmD [Acidiluteibacter ferrifornacis]|uniref:23S rRNA (Uracil(1939)-C(5))-methyltransferase RlmD n=1 Tax=Acidiluteibacter ferrifornacis TaxID=2692424 RepID=A0A6N9NH34_9FLAO|nr:23S rRNA (uracil(1939)-C(5))-methyltransferase RlmD [Acidiluteibacter ferrifornacis]NBG65978.1 23S rRNA (uracil(1939)-C(5))-methyltransferase RlmD [Acidiluteibacter ferrifornacis]
MGRRIRKRIPIMENVTVLDAVAEGKTLAKVDDLVIFLNNAVPGDVVDIQVYKKKRNYVEGKAIKFHKYSDKRVEPFCEHFGVCGGCKWQFLSYEDQLGYKAKQVKDNLERLAKIELPDFEPILGAPKTTYYRNKLEYTFSNKRWFTDEEIAKEDDLDQDGLGFHVPGRFDKVLDINHCYLQADPSNQIRLAVRAYAKANNLSFFDIRDQHGLLRNLIIRTASTGELMVIVVFYQEEKDKRIGLLQHLADKFPQITSLLYVINGKANDTIGDQEVITFKGNDHMLEAMTDFQDPTKKIQFKVGPKSFYQTNSEQAENLYQITAKFANIQPNQTVYDLYTGTGTIANYIAKSAKKVVGVEYVPEAIEDAKHNSELNGIQNTSFFAGDMKDVLTADFVEENGKADVIITDPPRAGMHPAVIERMLEMNAERIVYVSCNPATQARDLQALDANYKVIKVQAVDMFPHTHHIENVVLLERK